MHSHMSKHIFFCSRKFLGPVHDRKFGRLKVPFSCLSGRKDGEPEETSGTLLNPREAKQSIGLWQREVSIAFIKLGENAGGICRYKMGGRIVIDDVGKKRSISSMCH